MCRAGRDWDRRTPPASRRARRDRWPGRGNSRRTSAPRPTVSGPRRSFLRCWRRSPWCRARPAWSKSRESRAERLRRQHLPHHRIRRSRGRLPRRQQQPPIADPCEGNTRTRNPTSSACSYRFFLLNANCNAFSSYLDSGFSRVDCPGRLFGGEAGWIQ